MVSKIIYYFKDKRSSGVDMFLSTILVAKMTIDPAIAGSTGALGEWLAPLPFTLEFGVRFPVSAV